MYFEEVGEERLGLKTWTQQLQIIIATNKQNGVFFRVPITHTPHQRERKKYIGLHIIFDSFRFFFCAIKRQEIDFPFILFCGGVSVDDCCKLVVNVFWNKSYKNNNKITGNYDGSYCQYP